MMHRQKIHFFSNWLNIRFIESLLFVPTFLFAVCFTSQGQDLSELFAEVDPSVVVIRTTESVATPTSRSREVNSQGIGSGVLISEGRVLTAAHVVQTADVVLVKFSNNEEIFGSVAVSSPALDIALIQLENAPEGIMPARIGDSDLIQVGDQIFIIGTPYGIEHTLTVGHVSGRIRPNTMTEDFVGMELFQTDAAINQGNSGGPMFNMDGEVIGIVSHILSQSGGSDGIGFAATSNMTMEVLLSQNPLWTGADYHRLTGETAALLNVPPPGGLLVQRVAKDSPADQVGLRAGFVPVNLNGERFLLGGDIILEFDGIRMGAPGSFEAGQEKLGQLNPGDSFEVTLLRNGERISFTWRR